MTLIENFTKPYGLVDKIDAFGYLDSLKNNPDAPRKQGKVVLVTADTPLKASRGEGKTTTTIALIDALRARKFAGVGRDVYEDEDGQVFEDFSDDVLHNEVVPILMSFPNVGVTSHQAFFTRTALQSIAITTMENARAFARGEKLVNEVKG